MRALGRRVGAERAFLALIFLVGAVWFFRASDDRGATSRLQADAHYYYLYLPTVWNDHDIDFSNEYKERGNWYSFGKSEIGRSSNVFGVGPAIFAAPFFLVGKAVATLAGVHPDGFSREETSYSLFSSFVLTFLALLPAIRMVRRHFGGRIIPVAAPVLIALASPIVYYAIRQPGYAHPAATLWVMWLIETWDESHTRARVRPLRWWLKVGALLGAAALARPQLALWGILLSTAAIDDLKRLENNRSRFRQLGIFAIGAVAAGLVFLPQVLAWKALYGRYYVVPQGEGFMWWSASAWSEVLFSSRNGLFPWSPLLYFATAGVLAALPAKPRLAVGLLVGFALQTVTNGAVWDWWAGGSFGGRRFDSCFPVFVFGLAVLLQAPRLVALGIGVLAVALAIGNLSLVKQRSGPSVPIFGGTSASHVLRRLLPPGIGALTATASDIATAPARLAYSVRWRVGKRTYDRLVGVNLLGELFPGLNTRRPASSAQIPLERPVTTLNTSSTATTWRSLIGLNRKGTVDIRIRGAGTGQVRSIRWNGAAVPIVGPGSGVVAAGLQPRRGTNELVVETDVEWQPLSYTISSQFDARGLPVR